MLFSTFSRFLVLSVLLLLASCAGSTRQSDPASNPHDQLEGRSVTAKIDLPLRGGMEVDADGRIDFAVYRSKVAALGSSVRRYEQARIIEVEVKGNQLHVRLNNGGWWGLAHKGYLRWVRPEQMNAQGSAIIVDYGHRPREEDRHPERVACVLRDV